MYMDSAMFPSGPEFIRMNYVISLLVSSVLTQAEVRRRLTGWPYCPVSIVQCPVVTALEASLLIQHYLPTPQPLEESQPLLSRVWDGVDEPGLHQWKLVLCDSVMLHSASAPTLTHPRVI